MKSKVSRLIQRSGSRGMHARMLEPLETRRVFTVDFAYAGIQYGPTNGLPPAIIFGEGSRADNGSVTGSLTRVTALGVTTTGDIDIATMNFDGIGGMTLTNVGGFEDTSPYGADFRMTSGFPIGFYSALPGPTATTGKTDRFFVEQRSHALVWGASYSLSVSILTPTGVTNTTLELTMNFQHAMDTPWPVSPPLSVTLKLGDGNAVERAVTSITQDGVMTLDSGEILYFTNNSNPYDIAPAYWEFVHAPSATDVLFVDQHGAEGSVSIGVGSVNVGDRVGGAMAGVYRGSMIPERKSTEIYLGGSDSVTQVRDVEFVLVLDSGNGFQIFRPEDYGDDNAQPLRTGTWTQSGENDITLTDAQSGFQVKFHGSISRAWTGWRAMQDENDESPESITGVLSRFAGTLAEKYGEAREVFLTPQGHAEVYMWVVDTSGDTAHQVWTRVDLNARAGGRDLRSAHITENPLTNVYASPYTDVVTGVDVEGHVVTYERAGGGNWRYRDLTTELSVAPLGDVSTIFDAWKFDAYEITGGTNHNTFFAHLVPVVFGRDTQGSLVVILPNDEYDNKELLGWRRINLSNNLADRDIPEPDFSGGSVTGFTSPWGSINVIGLDSAGKVESVWRSPGYDWYVNNLSNDSGSSATFTGGLAPYFTTWYALNIPGLDAGGHVQVLWWTPETSRWISSDLTDTFDLPPLAANQPHLASISNYDYSAMAIGGLDSQGHLVLYWWVLGQEAWQSRDLTADDAGAADFSSVLFGDVRGRSSIFTTDQSVWGLNSEGEVVRSHWLETSNTWDFENVTDLAIPNG